MARRVKGATKWLPIFLEFVEALRIDSKEETATDDSGTPLVLWQSQRRFLEELSDGLEYGVRTFVCLKSRQLGVTTISLAIDLFWLAMHPGIKGALVVDSEENREDFRRTLRRYIQSFPAEFFGDDFKLIKGGDNRTGMTFSNGSKLVFLVAGKSKTKVNWGEGKGFAFAHLTECGKYGSGEGIKNFEEALAQKNPDRLTIYESTANGFNHWRDRWLEAKSDVHTQRAFFIGWWANPNNSISKSDPRFTDYGLQVPSGEERELVQAVLDQYGQKITPEQIAWYRWKQDKALKSGADVLDQNQPWTESQAFVATGFSFFQVRKIGQDMERLSAGGKDEAQFLAYRFECENEFLAMKMVPILDPEEMNRIQFRVWQPPVPNGKYVIGSDPAYGRNSHKDRHALSVWRCFADKLVQVAEFASADIEVKHFAWIMAFVAGAYSDCIVNYELGGPGRMIMSEWDHILGMLHSEAYAAKVKEWDWSDALNNARWYLYHRPDSMGPGFAYNFESTWRTQQELMHQYRGAYSTNELELKSVKLLEEMRIVVQDGEHIGAPESKNEDSKDDRVFAAALACRAWLNWTRREMLSQGLMYETVMQEESGEMSPQAKSLNNIVFNFFTRRQEDADQVLPDNRPKWMVQRGLA